MGPLKEPCSRVLGGLESLEAGSDECLEDRVPGRLHLSYSTTSGGSWEFRFSEFEVWSSSVRMFGSLEFECSDAWKLGNLVQMHLASFSSVVGRPGGQRLVPCDGSHFKHSVDRLRLHILRDLRTDSTDIA